MRTPLRSFSFRFEPLYRAAAVPFGITPRTAHVVLQGDRLRVRFGLWRLETPLDNVLETLLTGPYTVPKTIGPAHLSLKDRGVTFATNRRQGVCIRFLEPVRAIDWTGTILHPSATVTVADCAGLAAALTS